MNINFQSLVEVHGEQQARQIFTKVGEISGAGNPGFDHEGGIDISGVSDEKRAEIEALIAPSEKKASAFGSVAASEPAKNAVPDSTPESVSTASTKKTEKEGN